MPVCVCFECSTEYELLPLVHAAVHAPLPPGWVEQQSVTKNEACFFHTPSKTSSFDHPLDAYFKEEMTRRRCVAGAYKKHTGVSGALETLSASLTSRNNLGVEDRSVPAPWMEFIDVNGRVASDVRDAHGHSSSVDGEQRLPATSLMADADAAEGSNAINMRVSSDDDHAFTMRAGSSGDTGHHHMKYWYNFSTNECSYVHPAAIARQALRAHYTVRLQAMVRGRLERRTTQKLRLRRAVSVITRMWLMKREHVIRSRPERLRVIVMATRIQACWRGYACRKRLSQEKADKLITKVQAVWRGGLARQRYERMIRSRNADASRRLFPPLSSGAFSNPANGVSRAHVDICLQSLPMSGIPPSLSMRSGVCGMGSLTTTARREETAIDVGVDTNADRLQRHVHICDRLLESVMQRAES